MFDQLQNNTTPKKVFTPFIKFVSFGVCLLFTLLILGFPNVEQSRGEARRAQSKYNLKQIGIALFHYHDEHNIFPPGAIETVEGKPYHSWQTQLLPFIDQSSSYSSGVSPNTLYSKIDFNKPWTDPANRPNFQQEISLYLNPNIQETTMPNGYALSHYVGNELLLKKNKGFRIREITDGTSNTIMAIEAGTNFKPWGDPTNVDNPVNMVGIGKSSPFRGGNHILLANGAVRFISEKIDPEILKTLSTPYSGDEKCGF